MRLIKGVKVDDSHVSDITEAEIESYIDLLAKEHAGVKPTQLSLEINADGDMELSYMLPSVPFERIRRITGYLVGSLDRWNSAKRAEERDRVKHLS